MKDNIPHQRFYNKVIKRIFDLFLSVTGLILLCPLFLLIAILIKLDTRGPVFFKQYRLGLNGSKFYIIKFRTMVVGAENMGSGLLITSSDNRITKTGDFLRKTSLDELPQLINIIKGEMSIVGPRPPATYSPYDGYINYPERVKVRFNLRPGVTGLAQVIYRNDVFWEDRFGLDVYYVENNSFLMDVKIIVNTILSIVNKKNIYGEELSDKSNSNLKRKEN